MERVTVIIPSFRDNDRLKLCISALRRQTYPSDRIRIVIVDNTPEFELNGLSAHLAPAELIHEPRSGSYAARNRAISISDSDILAFTDTDCIPADNWIESGVNELRKYQGRALIAGKIEVFPANAVRPTAAEVFEVAWSFPQEAFAKGDHFGATANVFTSAAVVGCVGPFNAELKSGGDREFGRRVYQAGFPVVYSDTTIIRHPARRTMAEIFQKNWRVERGLLDLEALGSMPKGKFFWGTLRALWPPLGGCWHILKASRYGSLPIRIRAAVVMALWHYHRVAVRLRFVVSPENRG